MSSSGCGKDCRDSGKPGLLSKVSMRRNDPRNGWESAAARVVQNVGG